MIYDSYEIATKIRAVNAIFLNHAEFGGDELRLSNEEAHGVSIILSEVAKELEESE